MSRAVVHLLTLLLAAGRRRMELTPQEVADIIIYQVGAIKGFCEVEGVKLVSGVCEQGE